MTYVMSDIHGNTARFEAIMKQISLSRKDTLYILGDVVDRFPGGITLLRRIMKMPNVHMLFGNHELMMLKAADVDKVEKDGRFMRHWYRNGGDITHERYKHCTRAYRDEMLDIIRSLPVNVDVSCNELY